MRKKILIIASLVICLSISFVAFAVTVDELKEIFLTREEFDKWANVDCGETDASGNAIGMSEYLNGVEEKKQIEVYDEAGYQMYRRDLLSRDVIESMESDIRGRETLESYSIRRSKELESMPTAPVPPVPPAYTNIDWSTVGASGTNWMSKIPEDRYISEINMPGTHDAGMCYASSGNTLVDMGKAFAVTQSMDLESQLNVGVRFLDIRVDDSTDLYVCHGSGSTKFYAFKESSETNKIKLSDVLDTIKTFLTNHNTEAVVLCVNCEDGDKTTCANGIKNLINSSYSSLVVTDSAFKTLSQVKGKIVLVTRFEPAITGGLNFTGISDNTASTKNVDGVDFNIEDHYNCTSDQKKGFVNTAFSNCGANVINVDTVKTAKSGLIFTSAYNGMSTNPQAMANVINPYIKSSVTLTQGKAYGWVLFNFVDADLCKKVWETNP